MDPKEVLKRMTANAEKFNKHITLKDELIKRFCRLAQVHLTQQSLDIPFSSRDEQYFPLISLVRATTPMSVVAHMTEKTSDF